MTTEEPTEVSRNFIGSFNELSQKSPKSLTLPRSIPAPPHTPFKMASSQTRKRIRFTDEVGYDGQSNRVVSFDVGEVEDDGSSIAKVRRSLVMIRDLRAISRAICHENDKLAKKEEVRSDSFDDSDAMIDDAFHGLVHWTKRLLADLEAKAKAET